MSNKFGFAKNKREVKDLDRIYLPAMHFVAAHGVYEAEHYTPQLFGVYLEMYCDTFAAAETDDLANSIDYSKIYEQVREIMEGDHCNLLETLAAKIAAAVLANHKVIQVTVQVEKTAADVGGTKIPSAVKITRQREA